MFVGQVLRRLGMNFVLILSLVMLYTVHGSHLMHDRCLILRQHYGAAFKPTIKFRPIVGHWTHSFVLTLPTHPRETQFRELNCLRLEPHNRTKCIRSKPIVDALAWIQHNMSHILLGELNDIENIIPFRPLRQGARRTRAWIPIIGDILKTVTGTATTEDMAKTMAAVDKIRETTANAYVQFSQVENDVASMSKLVN